MADVLSILINKVPHSIADTTARAELGNKLDKPVTEGIAGQVLTLSDDGVLWTSVGSTSNNVIYIKTPTEAAITYDDILTVSIDLSDNDNFATKVSFTQADCSVFNPATGNWISCPTNGIDIAMTDTSLRLSLTDSSYKNYRYRWAINNVEGVWYV